MAIYRNFHNPLKWKCKKKAKKIKIHWEIIYIKEMPTSHLQEKVAKKKNKLRSIFIFIWTKIGFDPLTNSFDNNFPWRNRRKKNEKREKTGELFRWTAFQFIWCSKYFFFLTKPPIDMYEGYVYLNLCVSVCIWFDENKK